MNRRNVVSVVIATLAFGFLAVAVTGCGSDTASPLQHTVKFLTADTRGIAGSVNPAAGVPKPPANATDMGAAAADGRQQIAREIAEADLYQVSGDFLYLLNSYRGLAIIDLAKVELVGRVPLPGFPVEMYLRGTRAFVLVAGPQADAQLIEVNVTDPAAPAVARTENITGSIRTSRLVGDVLYVVSDGGVQSFLIATTPFAPAARLPLENGAEFAYATDDPDHPYAFVTGPLPGADYSAGTRITIVDIGDPNGALVRRGTIDLPGYIADDQKLNFGGGVLRVITHDWTDTGLSRLMTIDVSDPDAPVILATLELARGEELYATRFTTDRAYLVTFMQVDPLWVIDLSDPAHPTVAGQIQVPGFSTQLVVDGDRLVTLGVDDSSWTTVVSLFDVANPAAPLLLDRVNVGDASSEALWERKAFGVFPGLILVPSWDGLAVIAHDGDTLTVRGKVPVAGGALRGFPHGADVVAAGAEEVVVSKAANLALQGRVTVAENVVDLGRLANGRLIKLVQAGNLARIEGAEVPLWAEALYVFGNSAAILGWDDAGRAAYVISYQAATPVVSDRLDLGWGQVVVGAAPGATGTRELASQGIASLSPIYGGTQAVLTTSGKLIVRGLPAGTPHVFGDGDDFDGLIVLDIPAAALGTGIDIRGGAITGFTAEGAALAFTYAHDGGVDDAGRPLVSQEYVRMELESGQFTAPTNVPGYVVAVQGPYAYLIEEEWGDGWAPNSSVVAALIAGPQAQVLDRLALPTGAYDFQAAGTTLYYTAGNGMVVPVAMGIGAGVPTLPVSTIGTVHLGAALAMGPVIDSTDAFRWLLLPEEGAALISRDASAVEKWDVATAEATLTWTAEPPGYPMRAHSDPAAPGHYLLALGYAGSAELP